MLRTGRARFPGISAQASPRGSRARRSAGRLLAVVCPPVAARVEETLFRLLRTGRARFPGISAQASPRGSRARRSAGRLLAVVCPPVAARVEETLFRLV